MIPTAVKSIVDRYTTVQEIFSQEYCDAQKNLKEETFEKQYYTKTTGGGYTRYYKIINTPNFDHGSVSEANLYMSDLIFQELETSNKHLRVIKGIMITWLICSVLAALIFLF